MKKTKPDIGHLVSTWIAIDTETKMHLTGIIVETYGIRVRIMVGNNTMLWKRRDDVAVIQYLNACKQTTAVV